MIQKSKTSQKNFGREAANEEKRARVKSLRAALAEEKQVLMKEIILVLDLDAENEAIEGALDLSEGEGEEGNGEGVGELRPSPLELSKFDDGMSNITSALLDCVGELRVRYETSIGMGPDVPRPLS